MKYSISKYYVNYTGSPIDWHPNTRYYIFIGGNHLFEVQETKCCYLIQCRRKI